MLQAFYIFAQIQAGQFLSTFGPLLRGAGDGKFGLAVKESRNMFNDASESFEKAVNSSWYDYYVPATDYG